MVGWEEGILPHARSRGNVDELEEERRLAFVGITRAQERLIITKAARRTMRGISERTIVSPFLGELPGESVEVIDRTGLDFSGGGFRSGGSVTVTDGSSSSYVSPKPEISKYRPGLTVRHPSFGVGKIIDMSEIGQQTRAIVEFSRAGRKTLILEYARLEVIA
jgi:DNA helicase-2/ATP-dependent DNA helicase PcrA